MSVVRGLPRVFRRAKAILGESIVWDAEARALLWCDITAGLLHRSPIDGPVEQAADSATRLPPPLASFGLCAGGGIVASLGDRVVTRDPDGRVRDLAAIAHAHPGLRLNEGKPDPFGNWVTGSMDLTAKAPDGAYYRIDPDGGQLTLRGGFGVANGLEFVSGPGQGPASGSGSGDTCRMFFTDTAASTIYVGDYTAAGDLTDVKPFHSGEPHDGLTVDVDGCLWSGSYGGGEVVRYSPDGERLESIGLPAPNITSVGFGGDDLSTLFVASARENLTEQQLREHPLSGSVFAIETATRGFGPRRFGRPAAATSRESNDKRKGPA